MNIPKEPVYCDICKKDSIYFTKNNKNELVGFCTLPTPKINDKEFRLQPITGVCGFCGQLKMFFKSDITIPGNKAK